MRHPAVWHLCRHMHGRHMGAHQGVVGGGQEVQVHARAGAHGGEHRQVQGNHGAQQRPAGGCAAHKGCPLGRAVRWPHSDQVGHLHHAGPLHRLLNGCKRALRVCFHPQLRLGSHGVEGRQAGELGGRQRHTNRLVPCFAAWHRPHGASRGACLHGAVHSTRWCGALLCVAVRAWRNGEGEGPPQCLRATVPLPPLEPCEHQAAGTPAGRPRHAPSQRWSRRLGGGQQR